jgi:hypothetical protein
MLQLSHTPVQDAFPSEISTFSEEQRGFSSCAHDTRELSYECLSRVSISKEFMFSL